MSGCSLSAGRFLACGHYWAVRRWLVRLRGRAATPGFIRGQLIQLWNPADHPKGPDWHPVNSQSSSILSVIYLDKTIQQKLI
jgi:hypothetical protein